MSEIQGDGFTVKVIKSKRRKTTALRIKNGEVSIHIPHRLPVLIAKRFVMQKSAWIKQKLAQQKPPAEKQFIEGEQFLYLGNSYPLRLVSTNTAIEVKKSIDEIEIHGRINRLSTTKMRTTMVSWYKQQGQRHLTHRTQHFSRLTGLKPNSISIKTYTARWGSCGIHADIQFNWKLMLAPENIIDYVIIHELCHIKHHNHSSMFWSLVQQYYPDYKSARLWLKNNGYNLTI